MNALFSTSFPLHASLFSPPGQFKNSNHRPTRIVIFWQSPRKNCIFLCLSGSCLLFSMCKGKKWVGMPPRRVCGSEAWWHGWRGNGPRSSGRKREGGGWNADAPQVFAISPGPFITTTRPCHFFFFLLIINAPGRSFAGNLLELGGNKTRHHVQVETSVKGFGFVWRDECGGQ